MLAQRQIILRKLVENCYWVCDLENSGLINIQLHLGIAPGGSLPLLASIASAPPAGIANNYNLNITPLSKSTINSYGWGIAPNLLQYYSISSRQYTHILWIHLDFHLMLCRLIIY